MSSSAVAENPMEKFDCYSTNWWDSDGPVCRLRKGANFIFEDIVRMAAINGLVKEEIQILDAGCGGGFLSEPLARDGFIVTAIDVNGSLIETAQSHAKLDPSLTNLTYKHQAIEEHTVNHPEEYDLVILNFVLQHVENHETVIKNCIKALKPGGILFLSSAAKTFRSWFKIIVMGESVLRYLPKNAHDWNKFISFRDVEKILNRHNCVVKEQKGIDYSVISRKCYWKKDVDGGFYSMYAYKK